jgi:hypothetical protein
LVNWKNFVWQTSLCMKNITAQPGETKNYRKNVLDLSSQLGTKQTACQLFAHYTTFLKFSLIKNSRLLTAVLHENSFWWGDQLFNLGAGIVLSTNKKFIIIHENCYFNFRLISKS